MPSATWYRNQHFWCKHTLSRLMKSQVPRCFVSVPYEKISYLPTKDRMKQAQKGIVPQQCKSCTDKQSKTLILDPCEIKESRCRIYWSGNKSPLPPSTVVFFIEPAPLEVHSCPPPPPPSLTFNLLPDLVLQGLLTLYLLVHISSSWGLGIGFGFFGSYSFLSQARTQLLNLQGRKIFKNIKPIIAAPFTHMSQKGVLIVGTFFLYH